MTHRMELFNQNSFKKLLKPIPVSLGDDSKIFVTGKGTICLMFKVDGKEKEGKFKDVLYVPDLKVTLLSVRQSAHLPHCKVVFDDNVCEYIDKTSGKAIARAYASGSADLYTLDATPVEQKVAANLTSSSSRTVDINVLHRHLGHLGNDNCCMLVKHQLVDGVDNVVGKEVFCEGCAYGCSKRKPHLSTGTRTRRQLERIHIDICRPLPISLGGNCYFLLIIDEYMHYHWVEAKRVLSYLKGTSKYAIRYHADESPIGSVFGYSRGIGMQPAGDVMKGFSNSDWAGCVDTRRSTSGFVWIMGGGAICWKSKLQSIVALSSTEAEYVGATPAVQEVVWLRDLLCELGITDDSPSLLNMDN